MNRKIMDTDDGNFLIAGAWLPFKFSVDTMKRADDENYKLGLPPINKWIQQFQPQGKPVTFKEETLLVDQVITAQNVTAYYFEGELVRFNDEDLGY